MSECFLKLTPFAGNAKVELDLFIMRQKNIYKSVTDADTSKLSEKVDLADLKSKIDKLDIDELETTLVDLIKLSNTVKNEVVMIIIISILLLQNLID